MRLPSEVFVGREPLLESMRSTFVRGRVWIADAWGVPGSGKSALIAHVNKTLPADSDVVLRYRFGLEIDQTGDPDAVVVAEYATFLEFAAYVAMEVERQIEPEAGSRAGRLLEEFRSAYDDARRPVSEINANATVLFAIIKNSDVGKVDLAGIRGIIGAKRPRLGAALGRLLRGVTHQTPSQSRRVLITLDGFEEIAASRPIRHWVLELLNDLDSALVVVPRLPNVAPPEHALNIALGRLSLDEIRAFAEQCLPKEAISDQVINGIAEATDGHPEAVCLAIELLQRYEPEAALSAAELGTLPPDIQQKRARMVERILGRDGVEAETLLSDCAVMRKFDAEMLEQVVPEAKLDELRRYSFVEEASDPRGGFFRLHPSVRRELSYRLETMDPDRFLRLHGVAANHCAEWLATYEAGEGVDSSSNSYQSWYRYEDEGWQAAKREWLYHQRRASSSGQDERVRGRLRLARVFFDAFWWWGCYVEFPFCRALIDDWRTTQKDEEWTSAFIQLLEAYPRGYEKEKAPHEWREGELPRWDAVRAALLEIQDSCGLDGDSSELVSKDARHTRALIDNFMAHAARYESHDEPAYLSALTSYDEAVRLFNTDGDRWDEGWTRFERSELHLEHGHADEARADWKEAAAITADERDEELAANLHRVAADAHMKRGDADAAFAAQGRAVLHAYLFQGRPHPPDEYTLSFYAEQVGRALERLTNLEVDSEADPAARSLAAALPNPPRLPPPDDFAVLFAKRDLQALSAALFPDPPRVDELHHRTSKFLQRWRIAEAALDISAPTDLPDSAW